MYVCVIMVMYVCVSHEWSCMCELDMRGHACVC
jgi:hypothetical protein